MKVFRCFGSEINTEVDGPRFRKTVFQEPSSFCPSASMMSSGVSHKNSEGTGTSSTSVKKGCFVLPFQRVFCSRNGDSIRMQIANQALSVPWAFFQPPAHLGPVGSPVRSKPLSVFGLCGGEAGEEWRD